MPVPRPSPIHRRTMLKPLPADCLLDGQLHPSIRQRLARVRELPMTGVATLHGVERHGSQTHLVWQYVNGRPLPDHLASFREKSDRAHETGRVLDEIARAVDRMHAFGIVHGAVHERNVIVDVDGRVKLTHVSPLLYHDVEVDHAAVRELRERLLGDPTSAAAMPVEELTQSSAARWRPTAIVGAAIVAFVGLTIAATLLRYVRAQQPRVDPPVVRSSSPGGGR